MSWKKLLSGVMLCLLLTGCQGQLSPTQSAMDLRSELLAADGCSFRAVVDADYGDRLYSFTVSCLYHNDGTAEISVLQPEEIAGISAMVSADGVTVEFEDLELDFGPMADRTVSPVKACQVLGRCWSHAYISCGGKDGDLERITYLDGYEDRQLTVDTWLDPAGCPVYGEISYDGTRCLSLEISEFQLEDNL